MVETPPPRAGRLLEAITLGPGLDPAGLRAPRPRPVAGLAARLARLRTRPDPAGDPFADGRPWVVGAPAPATPAARPERWCAILSQGANAAAIDALRAAGHEVAVVARAADPQEAPDAAPDGGGPGYALPGGRPRERHGLEFAAASDHALRTVGTLAGKLPAPLATSARIYAKALERGLKHAFARALRVARAVRDLPLDPAARSLLVVGDDDPRLWLVALAARGSAAAALPGSASPASRAALAELMRGLDASPAPAPPDGVGQLAGRVAAETIRRRLRLPKAAALIVADLRSRHDFRYRDTALALIRECRGRRPVLLSPIARPNWNTRRNRLEVWREGGPRARAVFVPGARDPAGRRPWRPALMAAAPEASCPIERAVLAQELADFLDRDLAPLLATAAALEAGLAAAPPSFVLLVPGARALARLAAIAASRAGVPTVDVRTLLLSESARYEAPLADRVATILRSQGDLLVERFAVPADRVEVVGCHAFERWRVDFDRACRSRAGRPGAIVVLSQPIPGEMETALRMLLAATRGLAGHPILLHHHPSEGCAQRRRLQTLLAERIREGGAAIGRRGRLIEDLAHAACVVSLSSNAALHAGALGVPVVTIVTDPPQPVRLDRVGVALAAHDEGELADLVRDIVADGPALATLDRRRAAFFATHPGWRGGRAVERIVALASAGDPKCQARPGRLATAIAGS